MPAGMASNPDIPARVRPYRPDDTPTCKRLFVDGLLGGKIAADDAGADMDRIEQAYLQAGGHFWVAETTDTASPGTVVGMVGVRRLDDGSAEVCRLRVDEAYRRRGIGTALVCQALGFCQDNGYPRIILDTFMDREPAVRLFEKFQFRHARTRRVEDRDLLYFYLDLYGKHASR
jgi:ribosomal protein S18 acetylase RimI-like enzyme